MLLRLLKQNKKPIELIKLNLEPKRQDMYCKTYWLVNNKDIHEETVHKTQEQYRQYLLDKAKTFSKHDISLNKLYKIKCESLDL